MAELPKGMHTLVANIERLMHAKIPVGNGGHFLTTPCNGSITYHIDPEVGFGELQAVFSCNEENWLVDLSLVSFRHDRQAQRVVISRKD
jgi:hypothetical protein